MKIPYGNFDINQKHQSLSNKKLRKSNRFQETPPVRLQTEVDFRDLDKAINDP